MYISIYIYTHTFKAFYAANAHFPLFLLLTTHTGCFSFSLWFAYYG